VLSVGDEEQVVEDPEASKDSTDDKPVADVAAAVTESLEEADAPVPDPTPFEKMLSTVPPRERAALIARTVDSLSDEEREALPWVKGKATEDSQQEQKRTSREQEQKRQSTLRALEAGSASALGAINKHVKEVIDGTKERFDQDHLEQQLELYASSESSLRNNQFITAISQSIVEMLEESGEPLTSQELQLITSQGDGSFQSIFSAYLKEYGQRQFKLGEIQGKSEANVGDSVWREAELAAMRSELQGEGKLDESEPEPVAAVASSLSENVQVGTMSSEDKIKQGLKESRRKNSKRRV